MEDTTRKFEYAAVLMAGLLQYFETMVQDTANNNHVSITKLGSREECFRHVRV